MNASTQPIRVYTIQQWAELRGLSMSTARRIIREGRIKVVQLSERRLGIRSDHDLEFLKSCER
jgi:predicted site-specific integrase-resolvase